jgi:hypothetical protein
VRTSSPFLAASAALLLVLGRPARAEDPPAAPGGAERPPLTAADLPADRSTWFGAYFSGGKSGWVEESVRRKGDVVVYRQVFHAEVKAMGQSIKIDLEERWEYDAAPPFAVRSAHRRMDQNGVVQTVDLRKEEDGYVATVTGGGTSRELPAPVGDFTFADALAPERWFRSRPAVGASLTTRSFDLDELRIDRHTYTVTGADTMVAQGVPSTVYAVTVRSEIQGPVGDWRFGEDGILVSMKLGGLFEARRESEEAAKKLESGGDLFLQTLLPVDGRIAPGFEEVGKVTELVLEAKGEGVSWLATGPRQQVTPGPSGVATLKLGAAHGTPDEASPEEIARALEETPGYPTKDVRIVALAKTAVGDATEPREKVRRLVSFVAEFLKDDVCTHVVPVTSLLESKSGDCSEHAALFTTLARAAGVPAREVSGVMYMGDQIAAELPGGFGGHAWNEVALDGTWVPVDATHDQTELDATHIALGREGRQGDFAMVSGRLSFKVVSVTPPPGPPKPKLDPSKVPENPTAPR